jgi:heme exporter protein A
MRAADQALRASNVSRRFGYRYVLKNISFGLRGGEVLLLIGHNGAGKTTLIRVLGGLLKPSNGSVDRTGSLGVVAHDSMLYESLSARENLQFYGKLFGNCESGRVEELLRTMGLEDHADRRVVAFSRGMVQRLTLARALLPDPQLLLLDEPLTGLDDAAATLVRDMLTEWRARKKAVVLATHQLSDVVDLASHVGHLVAGQLRAMEPIGNREHGAITARYKELAADA